MYFPAAKSAKLKNPESLSLQIVFNNPRWNDAKATVPFNRKDDHWEAVVDLGKRYVGYAVFVIKDEKTDTVDDNSGRYWDVVFCTPTGEKNANGLLSQAQSYSGESWPHGIRRNKDLNKTVLLLETAVATLSKAQASMLLPELWQYKAKRDGDTAEAYAKLIPEIERAVADREMQYAVGNFLVMTGGKGKLPAEFVERTAAKLDAERKDSKYSVRAELAFASAQQEPDPKKRLAVLDELIATYPDTVNVQGAHASRLQIFIMLKDVAGAEAAFAKYRQALQPSKVVQPNRYMYYLQMARLYIDARVKLDAALKLIDEAGEAVNTPGLSAGDEFKKHSQAYVAQTRARAYLAMHKYQEAVPQAEKALEAYKTSAEAHFVLAQAYGGAGEKKKALEEYFEAALLPSNRDLEYRAELERFYRKNFGNAKQFEAALNQQIADRFRAANYVPKLLDRAAPEFEFTTLNGEKFDAAALGKKTVVVNFWSPS